MSHTNPSSPLWLFDLDNTLHDASHSIFPAITANMNVFIARVLGDGNPKIGAHGKPVLFLHPKDFCGTLVELEQA